MGKASRMKKERNARDLVAAISDQFKDDKLVVIDCNGVVRGEKESRQMYWEDVGDAMCERRASCLPEMAALGDLLNLSIFDVEIPVVCETTGEKRMSNIFSAAFLLDYVDCFQWLLSEALPGGCDHSLLGSLFREIVSCVPRLEVESPKMAMATMMGKFMAEWFHGEGWLESAMADGNRTMGQPFARKIAQDYLAEVAAAQELAELNSFITDPDRVAVANVDAVEMDHAVVERARDGSSSLRI